MPLDDRCDLLCLDLPKAESIRARIDAEPLQASLTYVRALGEPKRLQLAAALQAGDELCGCDLAWICGFSEQLVSHHLGVLRAADLVESRREGKIVFHMLSASGRDFIAALSEARQPST